MQAWDATLARIDREAAARRGGALFGAARPPQLVSVGANLVFRLSLADGETGYLKLIHARLRDRTEVEANAAYHAHLFDRGAPVPPPLRSSAGRRLETFDVAGEPVVASAARAVPGRSAEPHPEEYAAWGRALAALHAAAESFPEAAAAPLRHWQANWRECVEQIRPDDARALAEVERVEAWLRELPRDAGALGMTHSDCNRTNALYDGGRVRIIDFDEPMLHWFAADVARPFRELTPEQPAFGACRDALLAGYREVRALDERLERAIPGFVRMKNLEIYAWLADREHWTGDELPGRRDRKTVLDAILRSFGD
jgi:Ser/Thr protein kinase RdoA (MazF antagonist)